MLGQVFQTNVLQLLCSLERARDYHKLVISHASNHILIFIRSLLNKSI
ncbi:hypothetical protein GARC_1450 [Paraglaciecola arctica BSs20135]|uniref:Uncharacterized protein n=1 Tax=Paraglaciecola arctica BSs20135 TaxID=493475 RepID=K6Z4T4_9ALTE|nr:hypothetical protein GARC_1450 [Paraglaciecola arctica BSs20135]